MFITKFWRLFNEDFATYYIINKYVDILQLLHCRHTARDYVIGWGILSGGIPSWGIMSGGIMSGSLKTYPDVFFRKWLITDFFYYSRGLSALQSYKFYEILLIHTEMVNIRI